MLARNLSVVLSQTVDLIGDFSPRLLLGFGRHTLVKLPYREKDALVLIWVM